MNRPTMEPIPAASRHLSRNNLNHSQLINSKLRRVILAGAFLKAGLAETKLFTHPASKAFCH